MEQAVEQVAKHWVALAEIDYPLPRFEFIWTLHLIHRRDKGKFTLPTCVSTRERERLYSKYLIPITLQNMVLIHTNVNLVVNNSPSYLNYGRPSITASTQSSCVGYQ